MRRALVASLLLLIIPFLFAEEPSAAKNAEGVFVVSGETTAMTHAYAVAEKDGSYRLVISGAPLPENAVLNSKSLQQLADGEGIAAIMVLLDSSRKAQEVFFFHPKLPAGLSVTELSNFTPQRSKKGTLKGRVAFKDDGFSFSYDAKLEATLLDRPEQVAVADDPNATDEEKARAALERAEIAFDADSFRDAVVRGDTGTVKLFLAAGISPDVGQALADAVDRGNIDVALTLIEAGADVTLKSPYGESLFFRALTPEKVKLIEALVKAGADVNAGNQWKITPLAAAAEQGQIEVVGTLIAAGANVDKRSTTGGTALSIAVMRGHTEVVRMLLDAGANVKRDKDDLLASAKSEGHTEILAMLEAALAKK